MDELAKLRKQLDAVTPAQFGQEIAKVMLNLKSSHVYFILQQAYGGEWLIWEDAEKLLARIAKGEGKSRVAQGCAGECPT